MSFAFFDNFHFLWPWMVAFLPLPWLVRIIMRAADQKQLPLLAPHLVQRLQTQASQNIISPSLHRRRMPVTFLAIWLLLILAAMRPIWFLTPANFTASGKDIMLAVDLSGSMETNDMPLDGKAVDRLTSVKKVVSDFIQKRQGDRMGLVVFGSQAFLQSPLTYDLHTVNTLLQETQIGMAGNNTAIGDAIGITLKHLKQAHQKNAVMILLTDGSNTAGTVKPLDAANQAKKMGLKIYTIGIGQSSQNTMNAFFGGNGGGDMDLATLQNIAKITGGKFFNAADSRQLNQVYETINQLESSEHQLHQYRLREELFVWPLGLALLLSLWLAFNRIYHPLNRLTILLSAKKSTPADNPHAEELK